MMKAIDLKIHLYCAYLNRKVYKQEKHVVHHKYKDSDIIVFKGTNDTQSLTHSFHLWENEHIHHGYRSYADRCLGYLSEIDVDLYDKKRRFVITGHSIGSIAAALIANDIDITCDLVLFGSPRLATKTFKEKIKANKKLKIYNYINKKDIIAEYPFIYYEHITEPIFLDNKKEFINPLTYHSMKSYSHNIYNKYKMIERKNQENPFDEAIDML